MSDFGHSGIEAKKPTMKDTMPDRHYAFVNLDQRAICAYNLTYNNRAKANFFSCEFQIYLAMPFEDVQEQPNCLILIDDHGTLRIFE